MYTHYSVHNRPSKHMSPRVWTVRRASRHLQVRGLMTDIWNTLFIYPPPYTPCEDCRLHRWIILYTAVYSVRHSTLVRSMEQRWYSDFVARSSLHDSYTRYYLYYIATRVKKKKKTSRISRYDSEVGNSSTCTYYIYLLVRCIDVDRKTNKIILYYVIFTYLSTKEETMIIYYT